MRLSYPSLAFFLLSAAVAAPNKLEQREPSNAPINLNHALEEGEIKECGGNSYDDHQVYLSIQHAVNLQIAGETRGSMLSPSDLFFFLPWYREKKSERERMRLMNCLCV